MSRFKINEYYKLLTGLFEAEPCVDSVPDYAFSPLNLSGELYQPILDQEWIKSHETPSWPGGKKFAVCLTHDVDAVSQDSPSQNVRSIAHVLKTGGARPLGDILKWSIIHMVRAFKGFATPEKSLCKFEDWIAIERKHGARSTFFFAPESVTKHHASDCQYTYSQKIPHEGQKFAVSKVMRMLDDEGWEIGLHPSWHAHANVKEMTFQKNQVEKALGHKITSVRQHFLKFDPKSTSRVQSEAGFKYDSTLGFNDNIGFRRGTSYPFQCVDGLDGNILPLLEIPLTLQDGAMLLGEKGLRLDVETSLKYIKQMLTNVKAVGGVLNLSWHPHTRFIPGFWELYTQTLEMISDEDPYMGTVSEIGDWWVSQNVDLIHFTKDLE